MRVAVDATPLVGVRTGIGRFTEEVLAAFDAAGEPEAIRYVLSWRGRRGAPPTWRVLPWPAGVALRSWARLDHPSARRRLAGADVVHGTNYVAPPSGLPTVLTVHDLTPFTHRDQVPAGARLFGAVVRRAVRGGAWVHTPTEHVAGLARDLLGTDRVVAIPHGRPSPAPAGPDDEALVPAALRGRPYVLALGTVEPRKNFPRLVHAFGALAGGDAHLALAGPDGADAAAVDAAIAAARLAGRAHRLGPVGEATKWALLRHATVVAYPSLEEGFGLPVLEAWAAGAPVVASTAGALVEVCGDAAVLVDPLDTGALGDALAAVVGSPALAGRLRAAGQARLGAFAWADTARRLATLYRRAVDEGRP